MLGIEIIMLDELFASSCCFITSISPPKVVSEREHVV
jgi:hypothetical protein